MYNRGKREEMFSDFNVPNRPAYLQLKEYLKEQILGGIIQAGERLPSTREMASALLLSRIQVIQAYQDLEEEGLLKRFRGKVLLSVPLLLSPELRRIFPGASWSPATPPVRCGWTLKRPS